MTFAAPQPSVTVLAGGYGGARMSHGLALAAESRAGAGKAGLDLSVVGNTGDDLELHGLTVCPDLDTVMYTLADLANDETGWGLRGETWSAAGMLERYGAETWFRLGDGDLATHLRRTERLRAGQRLTDVTAELAASLGVAARLLPMTDEPVRTEVGTPDGWLAFQDYFVRRGQRDRVEAVRHRGLEAARPTPDVLDAIASAQLIVIAPSNPFVSVGTILAVPGLKDALLEASATVAAISPIVGGRALRGPADRMFESLGGQASAAGFVAHYRSAHAGLVDTFIIDREDEATAAPLHEAGVDVRVMDTVMRDSDARERLGQTILAELLPG
ncbi:2-phospho-L-lactate transferase [soil metagenome]